MVVDVGTLRELFRNLQTWRAFYAADHGLEEIVGPNGESWCIWDVEYLYEQGMRLLPFQQKRAIELCLIQNVKECEAAVLMGVSETNPVAAYATAGLQNLIALIEDDRLPRFRLVQEWPQREAV